MKKISFLCIITLMFSTLILFSGCEAEEPIKIEVPDSAEIIRHTEETTTSVSETTASVQNSTEPTTATPETTTAEVSVTNVTTDETTASVTTAVSTQQETTKASEEQTVYITPSGKKYHLSSTCGGKNSYSVSINDIGSRTPCLKCAQ